jgi:hypothetical protein
MRFRCEALSADEWSTPRRERERQRNQIPCSRCPSVTIASATRVERTRCEEARWVVSTLSTVAGRGQSRLRPRSALLNAIALQKTGERRRRPNRSAARVPTATASARECSIRSHDCPSQIFFRQCEAGYRQSPRYKLQCNPRSAYANRRARLGGSCVAVSELASLRFADALEGRTS